MKKMVISSTLTSKTFTVDRNEVKFSNASIRLPIKRIGDDYITRYEWFPLSQVVYSDAGLDYRVTIPNWLLGKKLSPGYTVGN